MGCTFRTCASFNLRFFAAPTLRWAAILAIGAMMFAVESSDAFAISDPTGQWTLAVSQDGAIQLSRLEILRDDDTGTLSAALSSELGETTIDKVAIEETSITLRYDVPLGDFGKSHEVTMKLRPSDGGMIGSVTTGRETRELSWSVEAAKKDSELENDVLAEYAAQQSPAPSGSSLLSSDKASEFFGAWQFQVAAAGGPDSPQLSVGLLVLDIDGHVVVSFKVGDGLQQTRHAVSQKDRGLEWGYDMLLGPTIPATMTIMKDGQRLKMIIAAQGQPPFLTGTGERVEDDATIGLNASEASVESKLEWIGTIDGASRLVATRQNVVLLQEGRRLCALNVNNPLLVRFVVGELAEKGTALAVTGSRVAAAHYGTKRLSVYDCSSVEFTRHIGDCDLPTKFRGEYGVSDDLIFVIASNGYTSTHQVHVIDISHPSGPIVASTSKPLKGAQVYDVDVSDSRLFVGHQELGIADFSNRSSIRTLGEFDGHIGRMRGVDVIGETAYVAQSLHSDASWLLVVDVSDPSAPRELGSFETSGGAQDVDVSGSIAFVADRADGLVLVDVSDPSNLKKCGFFQTTGHANNVNVAGPLVFLGIQGLQQSQLKILYHHR